MCAITDIPGIKNRIEQLEEYVYTGPVIPQAKEVVPKEETKRVEKTIKRIVIEPPMKKAKEVEQVMQELMAESESLIFPQKRFHAAAQIVSLAQQMEKKKFEIKTDIPAAKEEPVYEDPYNLKDDEDEEPEEDEFKELKEVPCPIEVPQEYASEKGSSAFRSPDNLAEFSYQLKGQIIVFVKKRFHDFGLELQHIEGSLASMRQKIDYLEKHSKDLDEKILFINANFSERRGDLASLKETAKSHQGSIANIMLHLERKAEVYAVNQKVSRKELTVIEDKISKLCMLTSADVTKLEEKFDHSLELLKYELDKKLFTEEFEVRLELLLHKFKVLQSKIKEMSTDIPVLDFEGIRPVEVKKYVDRKLVGGKVPQGKKWMSSLKTKSAPDSVVPILSHQYADKEASPRTAMQIQQNLESASHRESRRYVEGAYTKLKVGRR